MFYTSFACVLFPIFCSYWFCFCVNICDFSFFDSGLFALCLLTLFFKDTEKQLDGWEGWEGTGGAGGREP